MIQKLLPEPMGTLKPPSAWMTEELAVSQFEVKRAKVSA